MIYTKKDHTFVICAYRESLYLEECIQSVKTQIIQSNILLVTSTPNTFITELAQKYELPLLINENEGGMVQDWNFGYSKAKTPLITIIHQDDVYLPQYLKITLESLNNAKHPLIFFSDYAELREGQVVYDNTLIRVKRLMLLPLRSKLLQDIKFIRRRILSLGCPICCPSVTFVKSSLPNLVFEIGYRSNQDWQAWEKISKLKGSFVYSKEQLMYHRVHEESATTAIIGQNIRTNEDFEMFCKFWPTTIAKWLVRQYIKSQKYNKLKE